MSKEKEIVLYRESLVQSIIADLTTYSVMVGSFYINYRFIGGNHLLAGLIVVMVIIFSLGKASAKKQTFTDRQELIEYLQSEQLHD